MSTTPDRVAVIGLGNLGHALAETFLRQGIPTTVWNRDAAKADALVAAGATAAATAAEAIASSDLVLVALLDATVARQVLTTAGDAVAGRALVNVTSGGPEDARELATWAAEHGARYLHGAVYAVPQTIGTAGSSISYSGAQEVHQRWQPTLELLGKGTFLGADAGLASGYDVAILAGMYGMIGGFLHATAMASAAGVRATELTPMLLSWLADSFPALTTFAEEIDRGGYTGGESSLAMNQAGLSTIIRASRALDVPPDTLLPIKDLIDRQIAAGHGAASLSRAVESFRSAA